MSTLFVIYFLNFINTVFLNPFSLWSLLVNFAILLFFIGWLWLLLNFKNFLLTLLCIELIYFSIVMLFIFVSLAINDPQGQIYALLLVIVAAAESAIGLGILIVLYRFGGTIFYKDYEKLTQ